MAMSLPGSVKKPQNAISCELCETDMKVKYRCLTCMLYLCERCRRDIHPKVKTAGDHEIVHIRELGIEYSEGRDLDFTDIKCKQHSKCAPVYCETCHEAACPKCIAKRHKKHELEEFEEVYDMKVFRLTEAKKKVQKDKMELSYLEENLNQMKIDKEVNHSEVKQDIIGKAEALKRDIDKFKDQLVDQLDQEAGNTEEEIQDMQTQIDQNRHSLDDLDKKSEALINSTDVSKFFEDVSDVTDNIENYIPPKFVIRCRELQFVPDKAYAQCFGCIQPKGLLKKDKEIGLEIMRKYQVEDEIVQFMASSSDGTVWYSQNIFVPILKNVQFNKDNMCVKFKLNIKVYGLAVTSSEDVLLSTDESTLKILKCGEHDITDSHFTVPGLEPKVLHISRNNKLVIGAVSPGPLYPANGNRLVIVLNMEGKRETSYEYDAKYRRLFTHPWGITTSRSGNLCIIDRISKKCTGRLVFLTGDGQVLGLYNGRPKSYFVPRGIVTTESDNFIVSDCDDPKFTLHIFSNSGSLISYYNTRDIGIDSPFSFTLSPLKKFYIGGTTVKDSEEKAELYEVRLTG